MTKKPVTIVVIDDHPLIRHAIRSLVAERDNLLLVGEGSAGDHLLKLVAEHKPDVVILDLGMPQSSTDSTNATTQRFQALPHIVKVSREFPDTAVIILSQHVVPAIIHDVIKGDINGYILKDDDLSLSLPEAVDIVNKGNIFFSAGIIREMIGQGGGQNKPLLTSRQKEIVTAIASAPDASYAQHAARLGIRESSLRNHLTQIFRALDVTNITACLMRCLQLGIIAIELEPKRWEAPSRAG